MNVNRSSVQKFQLLRTLTRRCLRSIVCAFALALLLVPGFATLVPLMTLEEMAEESQFVVHGTVARTWTAWDGAGQFIWTHHEIRVEESLKGQPGGTVVVSEPGGVVGDEGMLIAGAPQYNVGDEVVLLVWRTPIGYLRTCGWGQGKFTVFEEPGSAQRIVRAPLTLKGVELVELGSESQSNRRTLRTSPGAFDGLRLEEFKSRLRLLVGSQGGGQ